MRETKQEKERRLSAQAVESSSQALPSEGEHVYNITIYCALAIIRTQRTLSEKNLDAFLADVLKNGYADVGHGETNIYPGPTITKINIRLV